MSHFKGMRILGAATAVVALLVLTAGAATADDIDFNFTGGTVGGVSPLVSDLDDDWGTGTPLPSGAIDADDFGDYIASGLSGVSFTESGLSLTATANIAGTGTTRLYGDTRGIRGGLGAYNGDGDGGTVGGAGSNDNIQENESVVIDFGTTEVYLRSGYFFDANHTDPGGLSAGEQFKVVVDGTDTFYFTAGGASAKLHLGITGKTFEFFNVIGESGHTGADFYVSMLTATVVPEPSTIVLMGAAGLGVIFMGRRRRKLAADEAAA